MIPFVMLIVPLYQLMVLIGWTDRLAALIIPWIFSAYGTFLMRQHFITFPKEIEEAALLDGASRFQILTDILIPASVPALATLVHLHISICVEFILLAIGHYQCGQ